MDDKRTEKDFCLDLAKVYQSSDWHRLSDFQKLIVAELEKMGYLEKKAIPNGFVGLAITAGIVEVTSVTPEKVRYGVRRLKALSGLRTPPYELPADSFLEEAVVDILRNA